MGAGVKRSTIAYRARMSRSLSGSALVTNTEQRTVARGSQANCKRVFV